MVVGILKSSFLPNVVEEIRHGCKHLQMSLINNSKFALKYSWVGCYRKQVISLDCGFKNMGLVKNFCYRFRGRKIVIGKMLDTIYNIKAVRRKCFEGSPHPEVLSQWD